MPAEGAGIPAVEIAGGPPGSARWTAAAEPWWRADGNGLDKVLVRLPEPRGSAVETRSFLRFLIADTYARTGGLVLHAAAFARPEGAAVLMARSGGGKTTAARRLGRGSLLADDWCPISPRGAGFEVSPSPFPGREGTPVSGNAAPLWRVAEIEKGGPVRWESLRRADAMAAILRHAVVPSADREARAAVLDTARRIAETCPVGTLRLDTSGDPWRLL